MLRIALFFALATSLAACSFNKAAPTWAEKAPFINRMEIHSVDKEANELLHKTSHLTLGASASHNVKLAAQAGSYQVVPLMTSCVSADKKGCQYAVQVFESDRQLIAD